MTLRDRIEHLINNHRYLAADEQFWVQECHKLADAVLSALPVTLSQLEMIERGEMVVVSKPGHSDAERPAGMMG